MRVGYLHAAAASLEVMTMRKVIKLVCTIAVAMPTASYGSQLEYKTSVDPSGCVLEHIAVEQGTRQFQFDGQPFYHF